MAVETTLEIKRLGSALGAEVAGVDLSQDLGDETIAEIRDAWTEHQVLVFRGQSLSPEQLKAFGRCFGDLEDHSSYSSLNGDPNILHILKEPQDRRNIGEGWHIDGTFKERPYAGAILYGVDIPPYGGDTLFVNMRMAYDALSDGMKELLDPLVAVHTNGFLADPAARERLNAERTTKSVSDEGAIVNEHPLVRTHPETGRKSLFVHPLETVPGNPVVQTIKGLTPEEGRPILRFLYDHAIRVDYTWRLSWSPGTLAFWDNRSIMHNAPNDYQGFRREMWRVTVSGDRPA